MAPVRPEQVSAPREKRPPSENRKPRREALDIRPEGFLCGDPKTAYYDLRGYYVVVRAKGEKIVERYGPRASMAALSAEDREAVRLARRRWKERLKKERDAT